MNRSRQIIKLIESISGYSDSDVFSVISVDKRMEEMVIHCLYNTYKACGGKRISGGKAFLDFSFWAQSLLEILFRTDQAEYSEFKNLVKNNQIGISRGEIKGPTSRNFKAFGFEVNNVENFLDEVENITSGNPKMDMMMRYLTEMTFCSNYAGYDIPSRFDKFIF